MEFNKIHYGDNLEIMRSMKEKTIDLICTDPPFNSDRNYESSEGLAFSDTWNDKEETYAARYKLRRLAEEDHRYIRLNEALEGFDLLLKDNEKMKGYLAFMGPRILEMHRLLKDTGSFYLHCDSSASHYLKSLLDTVFGYKNFRNQIIWSYNKWQSGNKKSFPKTHNIILFYSKTVNSNFNVLFQKELTPDMKGNRKREYKRCISTPKDFKRLTVYDKTNPKAIAQINSSEFNKDEIIYLDNIDPTESLKQIDVWSDIPILGATAKERIGYPTQKPCALYERIIKASSNEGDIVLDPFCGSGTTLDAAHQLNRKWIGIDINEDAMKIAYKRIFSNKKDQQLLLEEKDGK